MDSYFTNRYYTQKKRDDYLILNLVVCYTKRHETNESVHEQKEEFAQTQKQFDELNNQLDEMKRETETKSGECGVKKK